MPISNYVLPTRRYVGMWLNTTVGHTKKFCGKISIAPELISLQVRDLACSGDHVNRFNLFHRITIYPAS